MKRNFIMKRVWFPAAQSIFGFVLDLRWQAVFSYKVEEIVRAEFQETNYLLYVLFYVFGCVLLISHMKMYICGQKDKGIPLEEYLAVINPSAKGQVFSEVILGKKYMWKKEE